MSAKSQNILGPRWAGLRKKLVRFTGDGRLRPGMAQIVQSWVDYVEEKAAQIGSYDPGEQLRLAEQVGKVVLRIGAALNALGQQPRVSTGRIYELLDESVREVVGALFARDILIVESPLQVRTLQSGVRISDDEVSFILFNVPGVGYERLPLLPRAVHEAAHSDSHIIDLISSGVLRQRWLGEALCDLVALLLAGPSYLRSTGALVNLVGRDSARFPDLGHPSLGTRIVILRAVSEELWKSGRVRAFALAELNALRDVVSRPEDASEERRLLRQVLDSVAQYARLKKNPAVWEAIYAGGPDVDAQSVVLQMNVELARETVGR